jgi:hypothetical protein
MIVLINWLINLIDQRSILHYLYNQTSKLAQFAMKLASTLMLLKLFLFCKWLLTVFLFILVHNDFKDMEKRDSLIYLWDWFVRLPFLFDDPAVRLLFHQ